MSENALLAVVCAVAIGGCSTCHVAEQWRQVEIERVKAEERIKLLTIEKP